MKTSEIYAQGYEPWDDERTPVDPVERILRHPTVLIARMSLKNLSIMPKSCLMRLLFIICVILPIAGYYFMVIVGNVMRFQLDNLKDHELLGSFAVGLSDMITASGIETTEAQIHMGFVLIPSIVFSFFVTLFYSSQLISKEKAANALQVYFSHAISRTDYILGKFFAVGLLNSLFTLVPSAMIILLGLVLSTNLSEFLVQSWYIPLITGFYWLMLTCVMGAFGLYFSALVKKHYMASVSFIAFLTIFGAISSLLGLMFGVSQIMYAMNWTQSIYDVGSAMYNLKIENPGLLFWQVSGLGGVSLIMLQQLYRKIDPVEVIS